MQVTRHGKPLLLQSTFKETGDLGVMSQTQLEAHI